MLYLLAAAVGYYMDFAGPPVDTKKWAGLKESSQDAVTAIVPRRPGERLLYFYSLSPFDFREDGNLVTDQRVVSYFVDETGEFYLFESDYRDMMDIAVRYGGGFMEDTANLIQHADLELNYHVLFSVQGGLDRQLVEYIPQQIGWTVGDS